MRQGFRRRAVPSQATAKSRTHIFPPPVRGWIRNENLAASRPQGAYVLDNWFPTTTGIRIRAGSQKYATVSSGACTSLFPYKVGTTEKFFAADANNIFDITTVADADVIPSAAVSSQTSGLYSTVQIGTSGGDYLYAVNGDDSPQLFDGSSWTAITGVSTPAITGVTPSNLSFVWLFANRLFFVEKGTMKAWYLPVDSIGGAATSISFSSIFQNGGELLFGGTWSLDSGSGLDDKCVFVSSTGEVAVYEGTDPSSASTWGKVGVYDITPPMGFNATLRAGGDFIIATEDGMVPVSEAVTKDSAALSLAAITRAIEPEWVTEVNDRRSKSWDVLKWPSNNMAVVALPVVNSTTEAYCFVVNLETGAWCRYTGWDTECLGLFNSVGYFGTSDGKVMQMEAGGNDDGATYTASYVALFDHLGAPGAVKTVHSARTIFNAASDIIPQISISKNYAVNLPSPPNSIADFVVSEWDVGLWDVATWDEGTTLSTKTQWHSIGQGGFAVAPQLQMTMGISPTPKVELVAIDLIYEFGGVMV